MNDADLARKILTAAFPEECQAVGPTTVSELLSGDVTIVPPEEGQPFPIMEIVDFLKDAAQFVVAAIAIYNFLKGQLKRAPTLSELKAEIEKQGAKPRSLPDDQAEEVLKEIRRQD